MAANYDNTAWFYDRLSYLIFGQAQVNAQNYFLNNIPANVSIIIAGGGTGQILEALTRLHPAGLKITYVEISARMMDLSRKRYTGNNEVTYIIDDLVNVSSAQPFDVIITAFLFDNFSEPALHKAFEHLHQDLKPDGLWLNTDFQLTGPLWQTLLLKAMYTFFKLFNAVQVNKLPQANKLFSQYGYKLAGQKSFYAQFISTRLYVKP